MIHPDRKVPGIGKINRPIGFYDLIDIGAHFQILLLADKQDNKHTDRQSSARCYLIVKTDISAYATSLPHLNGVVNRFSRKT